MTSKYGTATNGGDLKHMLEHGVKRATGAAHHSIDSLSDAAQPAIENLRSGAHKAVDSAGDAGYYTSLALDGTGRPHVSYCNFDSGGHLCDDLKYARFDGTSWQIDLVDGSGLSADECLGCGRGVRRSQ